MMYSLCYSKGEFGGGGGTSRRSTGTKTQIITWAEKKVSTSDASADGEVKPEIEEIHLPVKKQQ